jgi:hypothetical protein
MEMQSSASKSSNLPRTVEPSFTKIEAELGVQWPFKGRSMSPAGNWSENLRLFFWQKTENARTELKSIANES